jgi:hypothetical protein
MARQENVDAVVAAIGRVYRNGGATRPTKAENIAESGVAHKTFYRVLADHPDVKRQLDLAEAAFDRRRPEETSEATDNPLKANPHAAIAELLDTIAKVTEVNESLRKRIRTLEKQLATVPASITGTDARRARGRRNYKLSAFKEGYKAGTRMGDPPPLN